MGTLYVVDAGVLFTTWTVDFDDSWFITTENIFSEIRNRASRTRAEILMKLERLTRSGPTEFQFIRVKSAAIRSGDRSVLSENDIELVALALTKEEEGGRNVVLVSTDFAVLNLASHCRLNILDPSGKFSHKITWVLKCPACKHEPKTVTRETECPVCGTEMRRRPLKKRRIRESF